MPELPDLVYIEKNLRASVPGSRVLSFTIHEPVIIRQMIDGDLSEILSGKSIESIERRGPFLLFRFTGHVCMVVHFMLSGRFSVEATGEGGSGKHRARSSECFSFQLEGMHLSYRDDTRMGKVYFCTEEQLGGLPGFGPFGPDILGPDFTPTAFLAAADNTRRQVRVVLMDHSIVNCVGNAYADEILFEAGIHPKRPWSTLSDAERRNVYDGIQTVMRAGIDAVERAGQEIDKKVRDHMKVRNKKDLPCPRCGTSIRRANVLGYDAFYCPTCQPWEKDLFGRLSNR